MTASWKRHVAVSFNTTDSAGDPLATSGSSIPPDVRAEALEVLGDALLWQLTDVRWQAIEQTLDAMRAAVAAGDPDALAAATLHLELAGPLRITRIGGSPAVSASQEIRDLLNHLVFALGGTTLEPRPQPADAGTDNDAARS